MKHWLLFSLAIILATACNRKQKDEPIAETGEDSVITEVPDTVASSETSLYIWKSDFDYTKKKNPEFTPAVVNIDSLIKGLNAMNEGIVLDKVKQGHDTLYTNIADSRHLTNEMGSSGAEVYIADVVLNLTEVPGIKYVHIQMEEGSHMQPGTWSKADFANYKPVE